MVHPKDDTLQQNNATEEERRRMWSSSPSLLRNLLLQRSSTNNNITLLAQSPNNNNEEETALPEGEGPRLVVPRPLVVFEPLLRNTTNNHTRLVYHSPPCFSRGGQEGNATKSDQDIMNAMNTLEILDMVLDILLDMDEDAS